MMMPDNTSPSLPAPPLGVTPRRVHLTRLMSLWRSAGWPSRDPVEIDLIAAGWVSLHTSSSGHETAPERRCAGTPCLWLHARRTASLPLLVDVMARQWQAAPGNYLAFFSSHDYLAQVAGCFQMAHPQVPVWLQSRGMDEDAQREFLARFKAAGQGIGFAVLGGSFAEGIDLPGRRLIGAFIATLGLPQVNPVNEHMRQRLDSLVGDGHACTYLYPGLHKVVQAAGRVIRTGTDQGVLHLLDDRFQRHDVRRLLPRWWRVEL